MPTDRNSKTKQSSTKEPVKTPAVVKAAMGPVGEMGLGLGVEWPAVQRAVTDPSAALPRDLLAVQRAYGNRAVGSLVASTLQRKSTAAGGGRLDDGLERSINSARGGGAPLDRSVGTRVGSALNADFSGVKVHADANADSLSRSISAKAFTAKNNRVSRKLSVGPANDKYEQEADHIAQRVMRSPDRSLVRAGTVQPRIQRLELPKWMKKSGKGLEKTFSAPKSIYDKLAPDENDTGGGKKASFRRGAQRLGAGFVATVAAPFTTAAGVIGSAGVGIGAGLHGLGALAKEGVVEGGKSIKSGARKVRDVYMNYQSDKEPVKGDPKKIDSYAKADEFAGNLMQALELHEHATKRNIAFLKEDEFVLVAKNEEAKKELAKQNEASRPNALSRAISGNKSARIAKAQKKHEEAQATLVSTQESLSEAQKALGFISSKAANATSLYEMVRTQGKGSGYTQFIGEIEEVAVDEYEAVQERNKIAKLVNAIRKSGRGDTLGRSIAKSLVSRGLGMGLGILTAGYLNVEKKNRGGEYSSTLRVSSGVQRWKDELRMLTELRKSTIFGSRKAAAVYVSLKGLSQLVITPIRNFVGWAALLTGLIGTALLATLVAVPVGLAFAGISAFLAGLAVKMTLVNIGINALLFIWNAIRRGVVKNRRKIAGIEREMVDTGVTTIAEGGGLAIASARTGMKALGGDRLKGFNKGQAQMGDWNSGPDLSSGGGANGPSNGSPLSSENIRANIDNSVVNSSGQGIMTVTRTLITTKVSDNSRAKMEQNYLPHQSNVLRGGLARGKGKVKRPRNGKTVVQRTLDDKNQAQPGDDPKQLLPQAFEKAAKTQKDLNSAGNTAQSVAKKMTSARARLQSLKNVFKQKESKEGVEEGQSNEKNVESTQVSESILTLAQDFFINSANDIGAARDDLAQEVNQSGA